MNRNENAQSDIEMVDSFINELRSHAFKKYKLYDGLDGLKSTVKPGRLIDRWIRYLLEEAGEIASAITRERYELAKSECIDLAHVAMLLYLYLDTSDFQNLSDTEN